MNTEIIKEKELEIIKEKEQEQEQEQDFFIFKKVSLIDKFNFYEYLSIMLDGGVTIVSALKSVETRITNKYFRIKIKELIVFITSGDSLSKSMKKMPDIFNQSETSILEAGEKSGTMVDSLSSLSVEYKKLYELRQTIKGSLTYPLIILIFLVVAVLVVMTYVVPSIIPMLDSSGVEKPWATTALIATSNFISGNIILLIVLTILSGVSLFVFKNSEGGKIFFDKLFLNTPLVGKVYKNYILASTSSILGVLMNAGVPVVRALILVGKSTNNTIYEDLFNNISTKVALGNKIVDSILEVDKTNKFFPSDYLQLLLVGEKTASLDKVCKKLNDTYTREVNYSLTNLTKWIEPIAITVAGVFVLWFAFAIFGAILKLTETVG